MRLLVFTAFFLFSVVELFAQRLLISEVGFKLSAEEREKITLLAEYEARLYNELFSTNRNDTLSISIDLYKKKNGYIGACQNAGLKFIPGSGVYFPKLDRCLVYKDDQYINVVVHEMGHAFMHHNLPNPPRWLSEGISEFFESLAIVDGNVVVNAQIGRLAQVKGSLGAKFDYKVFQERAKTDFHSRSEIGNMYNVAYSIVFFMMKTDPLNLSRLTSALQKGKSSIAAIEEVFGSLENFEQRYTMFCKFN